MNNKPRKKLKNDLSSYIGKVVSEFVSDHGSLFMGRPTNQLDEIQHRRLRARIGAIRKKKNWGANVHILDADTHEWITLIVLDTCEIFICGLSATQEDRIYMFGLEVATKYPKKV